MKKVEDVEINKPDLTSVKLAPLTQKKYFKNIFLAASLSIIIHTGLFIGFYCQASSNTGSQRAGQEKMEVEIDLRSLNPANLANLSAHVMGASGARQDESKQNTPIKKNKPLVKNPSPEQTNQNANLAKQAQTSSQSSATPSPPKSTQGLPHSLSNSAHAQGQGGGGTASTGNNTPRIINNPKPNYPPLARQRGQEGLVLLIVQVDEKGQPGPIEIKTSSGYPMLDQAALKGIKKWKFQPASLAGLPMAGSVLVPVEFKLQD